MEEAVQLEDQEHQLSAIVDMDQVQKEAENVDDEELVQPPHIEQNEDVQMVVEADHEEPEPK